MSIASVVCRGFGPDASIAFVVTRGYSIAASGPTPNTIETVTTVVRSRLRATTSARRLYRSTVTTDSPD